MINISVIFDIKTCTIRHIASHIGNVVTGTPRPSRTVYQFIQALSNLPLEFFSSDWKIHG
jgi:hypothetical protein